MFLSVEDALVHTVAFGGGAIPIVAHGGWTGDWQVWLPTFEHLAASYRCVAFDHRGSGQTRCSNESIRPERHVDDLLAVMDHHGLDTCVLAGESMGGVLAALAVERAPDRFVGLVLVATPSKVVAPMVAPLVDGSRRDYAATVRAFVRACVPEPDSEHLVAWGEHILGRVDGETAVCVLERLVGIAPALESIACPTLVLHGARDAIVHIDQAERLAARIPNVEKVVLEDAGHVPTMTRPEAVAHAIDAWIRRGVSRP